MKQGREADYVRTGARAGHKRAVQKYAGREGTPPEPDFPGPRQCSATERGIRCRNEPLPRLAQCAFHKATVGTGHPPVTGLYARSFNDPVLREHIATARDDKDLKDSSAEIALARVTLDTLLAERGDTRQKLAHIATDVIRTADAVSKMQDRAVQQEILRMKFWGPDQITLVAIALGNAVNTHVKDEHQRDALSRAISEIFLGYSEDVQRAIPGEVIAQ